MLTRQPDRDVEVVVIDDEGLMGDDSSIQAPTAAGVTSLPGCPDADDDQPGVPRGRARRAVGRGGHLV